MVQYNRETAFTVRCDIELKEKAESLAKEKGQSLVEWVRRAMKNQIARDESDGVEYCLPDGTEVLTKENLIQALRELKKEGFSFESL